MLNDSTEPSIYKLSSRAPRFFFARTRAYFLTYCPDTDSLRCSLASLFSFFLKNPAFSISISFFHKNSSFFIFYLVDCFYYTMNRVEEQVFFPVFYMFFSIHLPPVEEGEFLLYIMLNQNNDNMKSFLYKVKAMLF